MKENKLKQFLDAHSLSAYDLFRITNISLTTIYKIINGGRPRKDVAKKIVRATKREITLEDFGYTK